MSLEPALRSLTMLPPFTDRTIDAITRIKLKSFALFAVFPGSDQDFMNLVYQLIAQIDDADGSVKAEVDNILLLRKLVILHQDRLQEQECLELQYGIGYSSSARSRSPRPSASSVELSPPSHKIKAYGTLLEPNIYSTTQGNQLRDRDESDRGLEVDRLRQIIVRAGPASTVAARIEANYNNKDRDAVLASLLGRGAPRTMKQHINRWCRFEDFIRGFSPPPIVEIYPPNNAAIGQFLLHLNKTGSGWTVPDSVLGTINWMCTRIGMRCPDLQAPDLIALRDDAIRRRAEISKQADAYPPDLIVALEGYIIATPSDLEAIFCWWELLRIYGSLRFDDLLHVRPQDLQDDEHAIYGCAWQTKVDRKRHGTKFAIPKVGITGNEWTDFGWDLYKKFCPGIRDFLLCAVIQTEERDENAIIRTGSKFDTETPIDWASYSAIMKRVHHMAILHHFQQQEGSQVPPADLLEKIAKLTPHGAKVTMVDLLAQQDNVSQSALQCQGHWKSPEMPMHYTRSKGAIQLKEIRRLQVDLAAKFISRTEKKVHITAFDTWKDHPRFTDIALYIENHERLIDHEFASHPPKFKEDRVKAILQDSAGNIIMDEFLKEFPDIKPLEIEDAFVPAAFDQESDDFTICFYRAGDDRIDAKWHLIDECDPTKPACHTRDLQISSMRPMGSEPPDTLQQICKKCIARRPEIQSLFE